MSELIPEMAAFAVLALWFAHNDSYFRKVVAAYGEDYAREIFNSVRYLGYFMSFLTFLQFCCHIYWSYGVSPA